MSSSRMDDEVRLNRALDLAQEWGKEWLQPTQERLKKIYPHVNQAELDHLHTAVQAAMKFGYELVHSMAEEAGANVCESVWREAFQVRYPWVDERNLKHLYSTGRYYAWKDGAG